MDRTKGGREEKKELERKLLSIGTGGRVYRKLVRIKTKGKPLGGKNVAGEALDRKREKG